MLIKVNVFLLIRIGYVNIYFGKKIKLHSIKYQILLQKDK